MKSSFFFLIFLQSSLLFSQNTSKLRLVNLQDSAKSIEIDKGNIVTILYKDSLGKRGFVPLIYRKKKLRYVSSKVIDITDSLITMQKKFFSKKRVVIPLHKIVQIKKDKMGKLILFGVCAGVIVAPVVLYSPVNPLIVFVLLSSGMAIFGEKVIFPLRNVNKDFFTRKNRWQMEVY